MTNNATEVVIRRFDQHYQNFSSFESIESAQLYLGVFEKLDRFTPFSDDAQPEVRGKSPLQLAGCDLSQMPMDWLCRGFSLEWPLSLETEDVPKSWRFQIMACTVLAGMLQSYQKSYVENRLQPQLSLDLKMHKLKNWLHVATSCQSSWSWVCKPGWSKSRRTIHG